MSLSAREIELKLSIPDAKTMNLLRRLRHVGDFSLGHAQVIRIEDTYLDTAEGDLFHAGWACRVRRGKKLQLTLKSLSRASGGLHNREEWQEEIASPAPRAWPAAQRTFVEGHTQGRALVVSFRILQIRRHCLVSAKDQDLLDMSLDAFRAVDFRGHRYRLHRTLEAELLPGADASCIPAFAESLREVVTLEPEPVSKYECARIETAGA